MIRANKVVALILLILATSLVCFEIILVDYGFDLVDEGWHYSKFTYPDEVKASVLKDHLYSGILFKALNYDLPKFRLFNIGIMILSSLILSIGCIKLIEIKSHNIENKKFFFIVIYSTIIIFQMPSIWCERSLAYNQLSSNLSQICLGLFLISYLNSKNSSLLYFLTGSMVSFLFLLRPPSGVSISIILIILFLLLDRNLNKFIFFIKFSIIGFFTFLFFTFHLLKLPTNI